MQDRSSRKRKVRGRRIQTDRETKELRRAQKKLDRLTEQRQQSRDIGAENALSAFVETDEIVALEERVSRWLSVDWPVHLIGPTGCGKTSIALQVGVERDRPVVWINGDESLTAADLVGEHGDKVAYEYRDQYVRNVLKRTSIVRDRWVDNPLSVAVSEGATLVYNEFSRTKPETNNLLLSVFEEGVLERPGQRGRDRQINVHPEFRAILVSNSVEYAGVYRPQDALLDRLIGIHMGFYGFETEVEIVAAHVDLPRERVEEIVETIRSLREELDVIVGTRAAVMVAEGFAAFPDDHDPAEIYVDVLGSKASTPEEYDRLRSTVAQHVS